jgi:hypothetical protein
MFEKIKKAINKPCPCCTESPKNEKYYICPKYYICAGCGNLTTQTKISEEIDMSGLGMCDCEFMAWEWSEEFQNIEPWYPRVYNDWMEISKKWYDILLGEENAILRLRMFSAIPKSKRMLA